MQFNKLFVWNYLKRQEEKYDQTNKQNARTLTCRACSETTPYFRILEIKNLNRQMFS